MINSSLIVVARVLLALIFISSGIAKFGDPSSTASMIQMAGLPAPSVLTYLAGLFELAAGVAVLVGFQTRIAAGALALFCLFTAFVFHSGAMAIPGFPDEANGMLTTMNTIMMWKNITLAGGYLLLAVVGAGPLSLDARLKGKFGLAKA
ncbi:putative membrane protein [Rhizobium sp. CF122]|uniref:DoxX family protein n=1 Tax=Rhizobium sp. CF122 TaxID=1144312 RepID=UPI0002715B99|nr:DoxX family protein [Rhizobium sp. CF122]EJL58634.1 putative membrane protein [Rhizobium sp. CF122]